MNHSTITSFVIPRFMRRIHLPLWITRTSRVMTVVAASSLFSLPAFAVGPISFTVNMSEAVNVDTSGGTPRIAVDVGGVTRYAGYASGTGTAALTFNYTPQAGDVDLDGVTVSSPVDLNGGTIADLNGNAISNLTLPPPNTAGVKIDYPSLSMDFAAGDYILSGTHHASLPSFLTAAGGSFTRASVGTYFDSSGVLQTAASGEPRFDYDPITHAAKGILIEETRTNKNRSSQNFSWPTNRNGDNTISPAASNGPRGVNTMSKLFRITNANTYIGIGMTGGLATTTYTYSVYAKGGELDYLAMRTQGTYPSRADATFNLSNGTWTTGGANYTGISASMTNVGGGVYRCILTFTTDGTGIGVMYLSAVDSASARIDATITATSGGVYLDGAQLEQGAFPTSYIPTSGAAVTRQADILTVPTGGWFNAATGTLTTQSVIPYLGGTSNPRTVEINDGINTNRILLYVGDNTTDSKAAQVQAGGAIGFGSGVGIYTAESTLRQAMAYETDNARAAMDGTLGGLDTSVALPSVTTLAVGGVGYNSGSNLNGTVSKLRYYPARVADTQLQLLTQ